MYFIRRIGDRRVRMIFPLLPRWFTVDGGSLFVWLELLEVIEEWRYGRQWEIVAIRRAGTPDDGKFARMKEDILQ